MLYSRIRPARCGAAHMLGGLGAGAGVGLPRAVDRLVGLEREDSPPWSERNGAIFPSPKRRGDPVSRCSASTVLAVLHSHLCHLAKLHARRPCGRHTDKEGRYYRNKYAETTNNREQ
eukprot:scaffold70131_cov41-Phaeocystis_antarctica.AAC.1